MVQDGKRLENTDRKIKFENDGAVLKIQNSTVEDAGNYGCTVANDAGSVDRQFSVEIIG